jgi:transcriptional regulator with XRE-family HTH domain
MEVARRLGVSQSVLSRIENGQRSLSEEMATRIRAVLREAA